jgi:hypothetical protein
VLLLHGFGANGAQNNTFLDSSTNNNTITRNGNTTQGTFTPFSQPNGWWGNFFVESTNSRLKFPSGNIWPASSNFTLEAWIWPIPSTNAYTTATIASQATQPNTDNGRTALTLTAAGLLQYGMGESFSFNSGSTTVSFYRWSHVAVTRSGNTFTLYINGTSVGSGSSSKSVDAGFFNVGTIWDGDGVGLLPWSGYISNLRIVSSVVYSGNFTPSTAPLTAITGTNILTCQSNSFLDNSSNAYSPTVSGTPSVQSFGPFLPNGAVYGNLTTGGSGYYDGSGDFLNTPSTGQFTAAGDFTVSCWFYLQSFAASYYAAGGNWSAGASDEWLIQLANDGSIRFLTSADGTFSSAGVVKLNQWTYFTATRSGTTVTVQVNGTTVRTYTKSDTLGSATKSINIGQQPGNNWPWNGYIADFRLVSGSAITAIPTSPATAISGTGLLLSCTNNGIFDNDSSNNFETLGNAQISTTQSKFNTSSMYFDGTGDYLTSGASSPSYDWQGDITVEAWVYPSSLNGSASQGYGIVGTHFASLDGKTCIYIYGNGKPGVGKIGVNEITGSAGNIVAGSWQHLAVVRSGSTTTIYVNGSSVGSGTTAVWSTGSSPIYIAYAASPNIVFNGYINDLRITKGIARYTTNFTPSSVPFPDI